MTSLINLSASLTVAPIVGKSGAISKSYDTAASIVGSMNNAAILGAAMSAKGAIGATARATIAPYALTLSGMLARDTLDGSDWGNLLGLLVGQHGLQSFNRATMRGKSGVMEYLRTTSQALCLKVDIADTVKGQDRAIALLKAFQADQVQVTRLYEASEAARIAAQSEATA